MIIKKSESGLAMPLVLIIMLVLMLLGAALWHYSISNINQAVMEENKTRAHYLARAGAESVAKNIMRYPGKVNDYFDDVEEGAYVESNPLKLNEGENEKIEVKMKMKSDSEQIEIRGYGKAEGIEESVLIVLEKDSFKEPIYSLNNMDFDEGITVLGDIVTGGYVFPKPLPNHKGEMTEEKEINFPEPDFPDEAGEGDLDEDLVIDQSEYNFPDDYNNDPNSGNDDQSYYFNSIEINNHCKLKIDAPTFIEVKDLEMRQHAGLIFNTGDEDIIQLVAYDIHDLRNVEVTGDGIVEIYVRPEGKVHFQTKMGELTSEDGDAKVVVYLGELSSMELQANDASFEGYVYGPKGNVKMGNNTHFSGSMIVNQLMAYAGGSIGGPQSEVKDPLDWDDLGIADLGVYWEMYYWSD